MKNIFQKFLTNKKNRKLTIGNQNEFQGIISPVSPVAIVDEPITFSSDVNFINANLAGTATKLLGVDTNGKVVETPYAGYKVYTARVMFNGVDGFPVPTILENTLGGSPAWSKDATGIYSIVLSNAFTTGKVFISHTQVSTTNTKQIIQEINSSTLQINNYDLTSTPALSDITTTTPMFVEIRVYP